MAVNQKMRNALGNNSFHTRLLGESLCAVCNGVKDMVVGPRLISAMPRHLTQFSF